MKASIEKKYEKESERRAFNEWINLCDIWENAVCGMM